MPELAGHGERDPDEYYATRPELAKLVCHTLRTDLISRPRAILEPSSILEPGCGSGSWLPGIRDTWPNANILGVERNPDLADYSRRRGFTVEQRDLLQGELGRYDLVVGNPPFKYADELIPMLLSCLNPGGILAFLLRLNFFEGQTRYERFWRIHPVSALYPIVARPGFTPNGATDGTGYGVFVWQQGYAGEFPVLRHLDNRFVPFKWDGTPERRKTRKDGTVAITPAVLDPNFPDPRKGRALDQLPPAVTRPRRRRDRPVHPLTPAPTIHPHA